MDSRAPASNTVYQRRIDRVFDHIRAHLGTTLDLATLADVAHFSPWHFHRIFQAMTGETLADAVRRLRLEAAAQRLLRRAHEPAHRPGIELHDDSFTMDEKTGAFSCRLCLPIEG